MTEEKKKNSIIHLPWFTLATFECCCRKLRFTIFHGCGRYRFSIMIVDRDWPTNVVNAALLLFTKGNQKWVSQKRDSLAGNQLTSSHNFLNLKFPRVTKKEFLLTISIQVQADKWWEYRKYKYLIGNYLLIQYQTPQSNIIRIVWQTVRRIIERSWKWKGQRKDAALYSTKIQIRYLWRCSQGF